MMEEACETFSRRQDIDKHRFILNYEIAGQDDHLVQQKLDHPV